MRFVAVGASEDIVMTLSLKSFIIGVYKVIKVATFIFSGISPTVFVPTATPVNRFQVPAKISAIDSIVSIMTICTKCHVVRKIRTILSRIITWLIVCPTAPIGGLVLTGVSVHSFRSLIAPQIVMVTGTRYRGSSRVIGTIIVFLRDMRVVAATAWILDFI